MTRPFSQTDLSLVLGIPDFGSYRDQIQSIFDVGPERILFAPDFQPTFAKHVRCRGAKFIDETQLNIQALLARMGPGAFVVVGSYLYEPMLPHLHKFKSVQWFVGTPIEDRLIVSDTQEMKGNHNRALPYLEYCLERKRANIRALREDPMQVVKWLGGVPLSLDTEAPPLWDATKHKLDLDDIDPDSPLDRFLGAVVCFIIGDACGVPYELSLKSVSQHSTKELLYPIDLTLCLRTRARFGHFRCSVPGQASDDTTMLGLAIDGLQNGPDWRHRARRYINWAKSKIRPAGMGYTTEKRFKTEPKGRNRAQQLAAFEELWKERSAQCTDESQSNGPLMRALAFVALPEVDRAVRLAREDATLSNANAPVQNCVEFLVRWLWTLVHNPNTSLDPLQLAASLDDDELVRQVKSALGGGRPSESLSKPSKGWCYNPIWCVIRAYGLRETSVHTAIERTLNLGRDTDTDTNCAIVGSAIGASVGLCAVLQQNDVTPLVEAVLNAPIEFTTMPLGDGAKHPRDIIAEAQHWFEVAQKIQCAVPGPGCKRRILQ